MVALIAIYHTLLSFGPHFHMDIKAEISLPSLRAWAQANFLEMHTGILIPMHFDRVALHPLVS